MTRESLLLWHNKILSSLEISQKTECLRLVPAWMCSWHIANGMFVFRCRHLCCFSSCLIVSRIHKNVGKIRASFEWTLELFNLTILLCWVSDKILLRSSRIYLLVYALPVLIFPLFWFKDWSSSFLFFSYNLRIIDLTSNLKHPEHVKRVTLLHTERSHSSKMTLFCYANENTASRNYKLA